jgi:hypothetical protein
VAAAGDGVAMRGGLIQSHSWPDWAYRTGKSSPKEQDQTRKAICSRCGLDLDTAMDLAVEWGLGCGTTPQRTTPMKILI